MVKFNILPWKWYWFYPHLLLIKNKEVKKKLYY
jgi:hypothetical protein